MLNTVKRDERRAQEALFKQLVQGRDKMAEMENEIMRLQNQLQDFDTIRAENAKNNQILAGLFDKNIIDVNGDLMSLLLVYTSNPNCSLNTFL